MSVSSSIEIALATHESARFLRPLLDSLFSQTEQGFTLLVADDGSRDATMTIIDEYAERYEGRIRIIARERQPGGALGNFSRLIGHASADYLFLCDHDDVWDSNKIALSLARMVELVRAHGEAVPLLVHTDLTVVDEDLRLLGPSFFEYQNLRPERTGLAALLTANIATGCTIIVNKALYKKASPIPSAAVMHDHWLALVASAFGVIACVRQPSILYRQHGGNVIGARRSSTASILQRVRLTLFSDNRQREIHHYSRQAAALLERYGSEMAPEHQSVTRVLAEIWSVSRWRRFTRLRSSGLGPIGLLRSIGLFIVMSRKFSDQSE